MTAATFLTLMSSGLTVTPIFSSIEDMHCSVKRASVTVAGAGQADDQPIAHQLVRTDPAEGRDVFEARGLAFGARPPPGRPAVRTRAQKVERPFSSYVD